MGFFGHKFQVCLRFFLLDNRDKVVRTILQDEKPACKTMVSTMETLPTMTRCNKKVTTTFDTCLFHPYTYFG